MATHQNVVGSISGWWGLWVIFTFILTLFFFSHTFTLSVVFTKSMEFYVQKNNKCYFHIEIKRVRKRAERRGEKGKLHQKQTKITAPPLPPPKTL